VNVRHNARVDRFQVDITTAAKTAGVAFPSTITAQDAYGNTMDNRNGATAFAPTNNVGLSAGPAPTPSIRSLCSCRTMASAILR
jgi:hypothetical protein